MDVQCFYTVIKNTGMSTMIMIADSVLGYKSMSWDYPLKDEIIN